MADGNTMDYRELVLDLRDRAVRGHGADERLADRAADAIEALLADAGRRDALLRHLAKVPAHPKAEE